MPTPSFVIGIDQGTSGSRALILDREGQVRGYGYRPLARLYPEAGRVEQDPYAVAATVSDAMSEALRQAGITPSEVAAVGLASQRNTDFAWDAHTRRPVGNAITWQDLRTVDLVAELSGWPEAVNWRERLGYFPGPWSSAMHLAWRMRHDRAFADAAHTGALRVGPSAEWLLVALGEARDHAADLSLVQQMGMYDFRAHCYWEEWLARLGVPRSILPDAVPTVRDHGVLRLTGPNGEEADVPVLAMIGDQQAALYGYDCRQAGDAECTHGTATFVDVCTGSHAPQQERINVYYAWEIDGEITYCMEADATVTGAAIRWMRESARLFDRDEEVGPLAGSVPDAGGVVFVPAFTGLNVPYNDVNARGTILGLTLGSHRGHILRAFLEALGYQVRAILETIAAQADIHVGQLYLGGGVSANDLACQIQADMLGIPTVRPAFTETTARAAALLAGVGAGVWPHGALPPLPSAVTVFEPRLSADERDAGYARWQRAVETVRSWGNG
ncbi:MAG: FGGY family carbohydrate kinase [Anaerolineae bacterium]